MDFNGRNRGRIAAALGLALLLCAPGARAGDSEPPRPAGWRIHRSPPPDSAATHTVTPGERFHAGSFKRWLFGGDYRDLWTTPIQVPVLDLDSVGGGLTPVRPGGFGQSIALHFKGADGYGYTVRSLDKDPTRRIWDDLKNTVVDDVLQDQIRALLPAGVLVCDSLMGAAGILYEPSRLVVIPDDPRLGEFRREYAGLIGTLLQDPSEGPGHTPGFAGSRQVSGSEGLWERLGKGPRNRVDARAYLTARLMDFLLNDKDRHSGQWRWARFPAGDGYTWLPIPEDRDQAFIDLDGFAMTLARQALPSQIRFEEEYPDMIGLTMTGWEMDRELLVELERPAWDSTVTAFQSRLTDGVIDGAVRRLPPAYYDQIGPRLAEILKARRDGLPDFADRYYLLISRQAEISVTDADEYAEFEHAANGDLAVRIGLLADSTGARGVPYFRRTFHPSETDEVRLYLRGGDDRADVLGGSGRINVRIDGGGGDDTFVNASRSGARRTHFYDFLGGNRFDKGAGARVDERPFERPPGAGGTNMKFALDWGHDVTLFPGVSVSPDLGAYVGFTGTRENYGWRKVPFSTRHTVHLGLASNGPIPFAGYSGAFRHVYPNVDAHLRLEYSGLDVIRFNGLGNATGIPEASSYYKVDRKTFLFAPSLEAEAGANRARRPGSGAGSLRPTFTASLGPVVKYSDTSADENRDRFIASSAVTVYGTGSFGQAGARSEIRYDTRDNPTHAKRGFLLRTGGSFYPAVWDVEDAFGGVDGAASVYLTAPVPTTPTVALRAGGQKVWGRYPFHEAAYIGGPGTLRGYRENRFGGDASAYGNAELRFGLGRLKVVLPGQFGLFAAADAGRVFLDTDPGSADAWHAGVGGGLWMSFIDRLQTLSVGVVHGEDMTGLYLRSGFMF